MKHPEHICRFNDAPKSCDCYDAGRKDGKSITFKEDEQRWMSLKDDYSEICRALGFKGDSWFQDPLVSHQEIVARAQELNNLHPLNENI